MDWALLVNVFFALGGVAGISALLNIFFSRKKLSVEAQDLEQDISDKVLLRVNKDNETLRAERDELKKELADVRAQLRTINEKMGLYEWNQYETRILILRLISWANKANEELRERGSNFESPPVDDLLNKIKT